MFKKHPPDKVWPFSFPIDVHALFILSVAINILLTWYILRRFGRIKSAWQVLVPLAGSWSIIIFLIRIDGVFALYIFLFGSSILNLFAYSYAKWNLKES